MTLRLLLVSVFLLLDVVQAACARGVYNSKICSGHGRCNTHNLCECDARHFGFDCSQKRCPLGPAWVAPARATDDAHYLVECSNKGVCDYEEGTCRCDEGFVGSACQRLKCSSGCNSAGQCLSLKELSATYAVGTEPLYDTAWDATMIYGCKCRKGYHGYDCSLKSCPRGDDPLTTGQKNEMQIVQCTATGGSFYLFYNGQGASIPFDATQSDLDRILRTIKTLPAVKVTFGGTATTVCSSATANAVTIEFTYEFGPQPPIKVMGSLNGINSLTGGSVFAASAGSCTKGDDPVTTDQLDEIQVLKCTATGGVFRLQYRTSSSVDIPFDAASSALRDILMTSFGFEDPVVGYSSGDSACSAPTAPANVITIAFPVDHGDIPPLRAVTTALTASSGTVAFITADNGVAIDGVVSQKGTKENEVCSNRGYCSYDQGTCSCSLGFGASDGRGNKGSRDDCGRILPKVKYEAQDQDVHNL
ncbi:hypothetical protein PRIC2_010821 [Phytophthora ramorum]